MAMPQTKAAKALDEATIQQLRASLRGEVIARGDLGYDAARKVYNGMIDRRPGLIVRCANVADVITAVNFARENALTLAVRGGGHNGAGLGVCDDGLVIDLSLMKGIRVDPKARTARVESGCNGGDVDHATHAFGLAVPTGTISTTGISGLTLGGGHGYLTRKYGLTIDNLLAADIVLADGSFVTASADENPDLFWAIRGGGGNFGVITSFLFRLHPVDTVYAGVTLWPIDQGEKVLKWYRDFITKAPEDMYGFLAFLNVPPAPPFPESIQTKNMCGIVWCYTGPADQAEKAFKPVREFGPPAFEHIGPVPFPALQTLFDPLLPPGLQWYWRGDFFKELDDEAVARYVKYGSQLPSALSTVHMYPINGAVHRVGPNDTAWAYRDVTWSVVYAGIDPDPAKGDAITSWTKEFWEALHPYSAGGAYVNFLMEEGQGRVEATYRDNYKRLAQVKAKYDPTNLFHVNQNIKPNER
jgi:FAD/FMN-containing dehydrogenase